MVIARVKGMRGLGQQLRKCVQWREWQPSHTPTGGTGGSAFSRAHSVGEAAAVAQAGGVVCSRWWERQPSPRGWESP